MFSILIGAMVAYVATLGLEPGAECMAVFQLTGTVAILGYAIGGLQDSIWKGQGWGVTLKFVFDGVVYGLATAGAFCWLWPSVT